MAGTSIDAIAEAADRTSGAVYDHFGGKDGVLRALLDSWVEQLGAVVAAELATTSTVDERLAVLWHNVSAPAAGGDRWIALELELWNYASRDETARAHLARRYRGAWRSMVGLTGGDDASADVGPAVIGLLLGLEMMRRVDPTAVTDEMAVAALRGVIAGTAGADPTATGSPVRATRSARSPRTTARR